MPSGTQPREAGQCFDGTLEAGRVEFAGPSGDDTFGPLLVMASLRCQGDGRVSSGELLLASAGEGDFGITVVRWDRPCSGFLVCNLPVPRLGALDEGLGDCELVLRTSPLPCPAEFSWWWVLAPAVLPARRGGTTITLFPDAGSLDPTPIASPSTR